MSLTLIEIEVAFGCGGAGALAVGDAVDAVIWVDAAATGDMVNATKAVQWSLPGGVHNTSASSFATHTIPGGVTIPVGAQFYVGLGDVQSVIDSQIRFPASLDQTTTAGRSSGPVRAVRSTKALTSGTGFGAGSDWKSVFSF